MATQLLLRQSQMLQEARDLGFYDDFRHMELHGLIQTFYEDQGKSERIKNFPFPRQYASAALWMTVVFSALLPMGLLHAFLEYNPGLYWLMVPFSALITWSFFLMEMIGDYSENPFEGTYNDVPITSIARAIEIDLREMMGDTHIPPAIKPEKGFLL